MSRCDLAAKMSRRRPFVSPGELSCMSGLKGAEIARRVLLVLLLCLATGCAPAPSASVANSPPTLAPTPRLQSACDEAEGLTTKDRPGDALALIERIRGELPPQAQTVNEACEHERLGALLRAQQLADAALPSEAQKAGKSWDTFVNRWVEPLVNAGLVWLGLVASFLLLARLFVFIPKMPWGMYDVAERRRKLLAGFALIVLGSFGIIFAVTSQANPFELGALWAVVISVVIGLVGALLLAIYLSSRLRISLEVRGPDESESKAKAVRIGAYLYQLGSTPPRGVEIPEGPDVTALSNGVLTVGLSNKILAAAQKLLATAFGVTPWRVVIASSKDQSPAVAITRNGWSVASGNIDRASLGLLGGIQNEDVPSGRIKAAGSFGSDQLVAAFILVTLASKHHGFEGLCGATDWRSVGLHFIATTDAHLDDECRRTLLGRSVELDPKNLLAEVAFQNVMFRQSVNPESLRKYADWLKLKAEKISRDVEKGLKPAAGYMCLLYRIKMTYLSVVLNLPQTADHEKRRLHAAGVARALLNDLELNSHVPEPLAHSMRLHAVLAYHDLSGPSVWATISAPSKGSVNPIASWYEEAFSSIAPGTAYDAACSFARNGGRANQLQIRDRLSYAFIEPQLKAWAQSDPELQDLRADTEFLQFLGIKPRQDFWELEAFKPYKDPLRAAGVVSPSQLPAAAVGPRDIRLYLNVSPLIFDRLVKLATLVRRAENLTYEGSSWRIYSFRVEVLGALVQEGMESPDQIPDVWIAENVPEDAGPYNPAGFIRQLRKRIEKNTIIAPDSGPLKAWLRQLKATPEELPTSLSSS